MVFYYYYRFELINERVHGKNCNNTIIDKKKYELDSIGNFVGMGTCYDEYYQLDNIKW